MPKARTRRAEHTPLYSSCTPSINQDDKPCLRRVTVPLTSRAKNRNEQSISIAARIRDPGARACEECVCVCAVKYKLDLRNRVVHSAPSRHEPRSRSSIESKSELRCFAAHTIYPNRDHDDQQNRSAMTDHCHVISVGRHLGRVVRHTSTHQKKMLL